MVSTSKLEIELQESFKKKEYSKIVFEITSRTTDYERTSSLYNLLGICRVESNKKNKDTLLLATKDFKQGYLKEKNTIQTSGRQIQLKRAFNNIIDNSKRYAKKIEIILYTNEKDCVIEFNDNGEGIPRDKYEDVFKPFFTLDPSRNKLKGESGLGLTITRDIIRSHGGDIKLSDSNLGGLQLKVLLPL